jgi:hypothetical protein
MDVFTLPPENNYSHDCFCADISRELKYRKKARLLEEK